MFIAYWLLTFDSQSPSRKGHTTNRKCANMTPYYDNLSPKIRHILRKKQHFTIFLWIFAHEIVTLHANYFLW